MSRNVIAADLLRQDARQLKMPGAARAFETLFRQARAEKWDYEEFLHEVFTVEISSRRESAIKQRVHEARFPEMKTLDQFDFEIAEGLDADVINRLSRCEWLKTGDNVMLAGPIGTGKTHLAIALGIEAARQRHRVLFVRAADLVQQLIEARDARELGRLQRRLDRTDLLILDEVGFVPFDRAGGELLFNVIAARYEKRSVVITTNLAFAEWPKVFGGDEKLAVALLDRVSHHATVITTRGKSFRMRKRSMDAQTSKESQTSKDVASAKVPKSAKTSGQ